MPAAVGVEQSAGCLRQCLGERRAGEGGREKIGDVTTLVDGRVCVLELRAREVGKGKYKQPAYAGQRPRHGGGKKGRKSESVAAQDLGCLRWFGRPRQGRRDGMDAPVRTCRLRCNPSSAEEIKDKARAISMQGPCLPCLPWKLGAVGQQWAGAAGKDATASQSPSYGLAPVAPP
jgi:hypothetical protein